MLASLLHARTPHVTAELNSPLNSCTEMEQSWIVQPNDWKRFLRHVTIGMLTMLFVAYLIRHLVIAPLHLSSSLRSSYLTGLQNNVPALARLIIFALFGVGLMRNCNFEVSFKAGLRGRVATEQLVDVLPLWSPDWFSGLPILHGAPPTSFTPGCWECCSEAFTCGPTATFGAGHLAFAVRRVPRNPVLSLR